MKIHCTVQEFGKLVRACEKGTCYSCAFRDFCGKCEAGKEGIESFITADSIEKDGSNSFQEMEE